MEAKPLEAEASRQTKLTSASPSKTLATKKADMA